MSKLERFVQTQNPRSGKWLKIDRDSGQIVDHKGKVTPYKNIPFVERGKLHE